MITFNGDDFDPRVYGDVRPYAIGEVLADRAREVSNMYARVAREAAVIASAHHRAAVVLNCPRCNPILTEMAAGIANYSADLVYQMSLMMALEHECARQTRRN